MNVYRKTLLEMIAETAGKHTEAEPPKTSALPMEKNPADSTSPASDRTVRQLKTSCKEKRKTIDDYLDILEGMIN